MINRTTNNKMRILYKSYLKKLKKCPFCNLHKSEIIKENKFAILTLAKSPYTKDHLLVIPKKHILKLNSLSKKQKNYFEKLMYIGLKRLKKKYKNVSILYREGNKKEVGKSINHLHFHLIPNMRIGGYDIKLKKRKILSEPEYIKKIKDFKKDFN